MPRDEALLRNQADVGPYQPGEDGGEERWRLIVIADLVAQSPCQSFHIQWGHSPKLFPHSITWRVRVMPVSVRFGFGTEKLEHIWLKKKKKKKSPRTVATWSKGEAGTYKSLQWKKTFSTSLSTCLSIIYWFFSLEESANSSFESFLPTLNRFQKLWPNIKTNDCV